MLYFWIWFAGFAICFLSWMVVAAYENGKYGGISMSAFGSIIVISIWWPMWLALSIFGFFLSLFEKK